MGLFDNLAKLADKGLTAVENGAVEKAMIGGLDKLEAGLNTAIEKAEKAAEKPEALLKQAEAKQAQVVQTVQQVQHHARKTIQVTQSDS